MEPSPIGGEYPASRDDDMEPLEAVQGFAVPRGLLGLAPPEDVAAGASGAAAPDSPVEGGQHGLDWNVTLVEALERMGSEQVQGRFIRVHHGTILSMGLHTEEHVRIQQRIHF
jgi:hypothetical protein